MPPPVFGLGAGSGYSFYVQDRRNAGYVALQSATDSLAISLSQVPGLSYPFSSYQANVPQLDAVVDRAKAKAQGVSLIALYGTMQLDFCSSSFNYCYLFGLT